MTTGIIRSRSFAPDDLTFNAREGVLAGLWVPYGEVAEILELDDRGRPDRYQEGFRPGAFAVQARSPEPGVVKRVQFVHTHDGGLGYLGVARMMREVDGGGAKAGLYGEFKVRSASVADVEELIDEGVNGLSIEFKVMRSEPDVAGIRWRTDARVQRVALEPVGAYRSAQVLSFRAAQDELATTTRTLSDEAHERARLADEAEQAAAESKATDLAAAETARVAAEAETRRRAEIDELFAYAENDRTRQREIAERFGTKAR